VANVSLGSVIAKLRSGLDIAARNKAVAESLAKELASDDYAGLTQFQKDKISDSILNAPMAKFQSEATLVQKARAAAADEKKKTDQVNPEA
jgi:hypothetical protein